MRIGRALAGGVFSALFALGIAAAPAQAADGWQAASDADDSSFTDYPTKCDFSGPAGDACFQPYGEWIWIQDTDANNKPVAAIWSYSDGAGNSRNGVVYDTLGKAAGWTNINKSFPEYGSFFWQVCEVNVNTHAIDYNTCSDGTSVNPGAG